LDWLSTERQEFWRARSNEAADENAVATFAYRIILWGMSRPLLKFGGGSVEILRDVLH
jgi:hypothetical protein